MAFLLVFTAFLWTPSDKGTVWGVRQVYLLGHWEKSLLELLLTGPFITHAPNHKQEEIEMSFYANFTNKKVEVFNCFLNHPNFNFKIHAILNFGALAQHVPGFD